MLRGHFIFGLVVVPAQGAISRSLSLNPKKMEDTPTPELSAADAGKSAPDSEDTAAESTVALELHQYELMVIISSLIPDGEIPKAINGLKELLGEIVYEEVWGMRELAYSMRGMKQGYYVVWNFMAHAEGVRDLEKALDLYPNLVRHLILKVPADSTPMSLVDIETGLEQLRQEKTEKRGQIRTASQKRADKADEREEEAREAARPAPKVAEKREEPSKQLDESSVEEVVKPELVATTGGGAEKPAATETEKGEAETEKVQKESETPEEAAEEPPDETPEETPEAPPEEAAEASPEETPEEKKEPPAKDSLDDKLNAIFDDESLGL